MPGRSLRLTTFTPSCGALMVIAYAKQNVLNVSGRGRNAALASSIVGSAGTFTDGILWHHSFVTGSYPSTVRIDPSAPNSGAQEIPFRAGNCHSPSSPFK